MDGRLRKPDDGYPRGIVREIWHGGVVVRGGEDVDCERSGAIAARVVVGGVGKWHGVAGREDSVASGGGGVSGRKRRGVDEQDDGRGGDDDDGDSDNDEYNDDDDGHNNALYIYDVYV
jgi:hypothetical protein